MFQIKAAVGEQAFQGDNGTASFTVDDFPSLPDREYELAITLEADDGADVTHFSGYQIARDVDRFVVNFANPPGVAAFRIRWEMTR